MLSRVAESLYWMARYIERAEALSRLVAVSFQAGLDDGGEGSGWDDILRMSSDEGPRSEHCPEGDQYAALGFLLSHPQNPNGVLPCLSRARENARAVRDQISSEMWEQLNRLYLLACSGEYNQIAQGPYPFFRQVRDGSQAFEGIAAATMTHGEAYQFIQLGRHLERASTTVRTLRVRYERVSALADGSAASSLGLIALLKSCGAFEPYRRQRSSPLQAGPVAEYLLLDPLFPRSVLFSLDRCAAAVGAAAPGRSGDRMDPPARLLGRVRADLSFLDVEDVLRNGLSSFLDELLRRIHQVGDEVTRTYFNTRVILPSAKATGPVQQQQQQQQQGGGPR